MTRKRGAIFSSAVLFLIVSCAIPVSLRAEPPVMKTLTAHVVSVDPDGSSISVDFHHPATDKVHRLIFRADNQSGFSGIESLKDLRAGQVVSIDYVRDEQNRLFIRHITRMKLSGPPAGLENFHGI